MRSSITWKKAGVIVALLHVGAFGALIGVNKIKSSIHRADREQERQRLLVKENSKDLWPGSKVEPKIVAYPKAVAKKIVDTTSNKSIQDYIVEKSSDFIIAKDNTYKYLVNTYTEAEQKYNETINEMSQIKEKTIQAVEAKAAPVSVKPQKATYKPQKATYKPQKATYKPVEQQVIASRTVKYNSNSTNEVREKFLQTKRIEPVATSRTSEIYKNGKYSNKTPDYSSIRYTYEVVTTDPYTGRSVRKTVVGPSPIIR